MATVKVFEELRIWQLARVQCRAVHNLTKSGCFNSDLPLLDQLNRASGSVMDNIAEGFDRFSRPDFRHFLIIARGSNAEVRSQLYRAKDRGYLSEDKADFLIEEARHLGIKINKLIQHLQTTTYNSKPIDGNHLKEPDSNEAIEESDFYNFPDDAFPNLTLQHSNA